ncbi:putative TetR-family transcriptional regulator [Actinoplanes missouriensis 431]|uniref:Putative TetR-family transcriptional regulator n=1 Tax=Actinoplanes missouriensis (strain ATCC 14538 / DSM 43046 / CBS 188.64 / JCM 3121 / NBRC 102363 / NCIMB 12654 / NRRL B-3342 / UNCC 431) TaxID=512565 RepID=I0H0Y5_ACTM4|nr:TetR/AcrR family transcriptional regulator [Actinoplanes missouriensis]BAL86672.1 putative TetR-family transcriptional regulator [Actinoplanes missouriensis 431]
MDTEVRPLRRDAQRNRERIIEAAHEVFATRGFAATLDDVAHHAGVGVGTVYRRFPTKEALVEAVFTDRLEDMVSLAEDALAAPSAWEGLVTFLHRAARMHAADRGLRDAALTMNQHHFAQVGEHMLPLIQQILDRAHAEGTLRADVGIHDFPIIMAMVTELAQNSAACRPQLYERYLALIVDGLRARPDNGDLGPQLTDNDVQAVMRECVPPLKSR